MKITYGENVTRYVEVEIDDIDATDSLQLGESLEDNPLIREKIMEHIALNGWKEETVHENFVHLKED